MCGTSKCTAAKRCHYQNLQFVVHFLSPFLNILGEALVHCIGIDYFLCFFSLYYLCSNAMHSNPMVLVFCMGVGFFLKKFLDILSSLCHAF